MKKIEKLLGDAGKNGQSVDETSVKAAAKNGSDHATNGSHSKNDDAGNGNGSSNGDAHVHDEAEHVNVNDSGSCDKKDDCEDGSPVAMVRKPLSIKK